MDALIPKLTEPTRAWLYRIVLAFLPILTAWGVIAETDAVLYAALAAAVLSTGLATFNTSTKPQAPQEG